MTEPLVPTLRRVAHLALTLLVAGCADDLALSHPVLECTASNEAVDAYVARIAGLVSNQSRSGILNAHESVDVSFALAGDGSASDFRLMRPSRPAAAEEVLRAAAAASPYPRPPFDPKACIAGGRAIISLIGHIRCDDTRANEYTDAIASRIQHAVTATGITASQTEKVALRVKIDRTGAATAITVHARSAEVGERVAALMRSLAPFDAPGEAIEQCVADHSFFVWVQLPGTTRPPVRLPDR